MMSKGTLVFVRGNKIGTLYMKSKGKDLVAVADSGSLELWHQRLGHVREKGMKIMAQMRSF